MLVVKCYRLLQKMVIEEKDLLFMPLWEDFYDYFKYVLGCSDDIVPADPKKMQEFDYNALPVNNILMVIKTITLLYNIGDFNERKNSVDILFTLYRICCDMFVYRQCMSEVQILLKVIYDVFLVFISNC